MYIPLAVYAEKGTFVDCNMIPVATTIARREQTRNNCIFGNTAEPVTGLWGIQDDPCLRALQPAQSPLLSQNQGSGVPGFTGRSSQLLGRRSKVTMEHFRVQTGPSTMFTTRDVVLEEALFQAFGKRRGTLATPEAHPAVTLVALHRRLVEIKNEAPFDCAFWVHGDTMSTWDDVDWNNLPAVAGGWVWWVGD